ncbi:hypothetical protein HNQ08_001964 [Deinococcus humi]|uniref:Uncharacterized protein n=1 Tax=Deinococcus humi TaxID=662880 RepID=A0A7W8NE05_9DEIO|nr:hypothetical protein [Deinococcus humi]
MLMQHLLEITGVQRTSVVQLFGVLDKRHGLTVSVGPGIRHGGSGYPNHVTATQPHAHLILVAPVPRDFSMMTKLFSQQRHRVGESTAELWGS